MVETGLKAEWGILLVKKGEGIFLYQSQILKKIEQKLITEEKLFLWRHEFRIEMAQFSNQWGSIYVAI